MNIFNSVFGKVNKMKKRSLIKVLYIYPIIFFYIGLSIIFLYYTILQIRKYNDQVEILKSEFAEKQRTELKLKILVLKDYVYWVQSHPVEYSVQHLSSRISKVESALLRKIESGSIAQPVLPLSVINLLDSINSGYVSKIVIYNKQMQVLYAYDTVRKLEKNKDLRILLAKYTLKEFDQVETFIRNEYEGKPSGGSIIFIKSDKNSDFNIGITFNPKQKTSILQEIVLDSLSKVKYKNNEYVFINTTTGYALLSKGKLQKPPVNILNNTESNWKAIFEKQLEYSQQKEGGFYTYYWRNKPDAERTEKTAFFSGVTDWGWIIGTGFFTNDIDPIIKAMNLDLWKDILNNLIRFIIFLFLLSILAFMIMRIIATEAKANILQFLNFFKRAANGIQIIDSDKLAFTEFNTLALAANQMIQEREKIKTVLSAEKSRLRYMIDAIPDLIFFKDKDSRYLGCNTAFEKYINKKSDEIVGLSEYELFTKQEAEAFVEADQKIILTYKESKSSNWIEYPNGQRCLYYTLKTPYFDSNNNLLGIIGISRDITEMEETRLRLIMAKEKAEESDKLKTAFIANMSHEIRTPMNAIIGFSDLLGDDGISQNDKIDFISKIKSSGASLMALINDIMDIAKIESGQLRITESECEINLMLYEMMSTFEELKKRSDKTEISLKLTIPEGIDYLMVITDSMRLQQVLSNIVSNAIKFTEFGSVEFGYTIEKGMLSFFVKDTGIGILKSKQKLLFQRFSQIDPSTTRKYGGAGLGLAISKNIVEMLGGSISMESNPGAGSLFTFTIPLKQVASESVKLKASVQKKVSWKGKTILIAEDTMQNFILMQAILKHTDVRLLHAPNGQIAIDIVYSEPDINLILMDIQLPIKTGYEALKEVLEIRPDIPVMSYTAFALPHEKEKSIAAGFVEFIPKPIKAETLIPLIDRYLQNQG